MTLLLPDTTAPPAPAAHGTLLLRGVVGSTAYGLAGPGSDVDRLGCYAAATTTVLGLGGPTAVTRSQVTHDPDQTLHEVGKYVALALVVNPTVSELLWLPRYEVLTPAGQLLIDARTAFLSTGYVRSAYGGYAMRQANKLEQRHQAGKVGFGDVPVNRIRKHGRHCFRLLHQGHELLTTGHLTLDMGYRRDELYAAGELAATDPAAFRGLFERHLADFDTCDSVLPETADRDTANDLLVTIRRMH